MKRIHWFTAEWPFTMRTLGARLNKRSFGEEMQDGFRIDHVRDSYVQGTFFEKVVSEEIVRDPFGAEFRFERISYRNVIFSLTTEFPQLEVVNPPRSITLFLNRLSEVNDFKLSVAALSTPPMLWAANTAKALGSTFTVKQADIADLVVTDNVLARVSLSSQEDVMTALDYMTTGKHHKLDKLHMDLLSDDHGHVKITLSSDGVLRCSDGTASETIVAVRESIPQQLARRRQ